MCRSSKRALPVPTGRAGATHPVAGSIHRLHRRPFLFTPSRQVGAIPSSVTGCNWLRLVLFSQQWSVRPERSGICDRPRASLRWASRGKGNWDRWQPGASPHALVSCICFRRRPPAWQGLWPLMSGQCFLMHRLRLILLCSSPLNSGIDGSSRAAFRYIMCLNNHLDDGVD